jgi:hypothetical protein
MARKKQINNDNSLSFMLDPIMNYLLSIEHIPLDENASYLSYTLGIPNSWIFKSNKIHSIPIKSNNKLSIIKIEPSYYEIGIDVFYLHIIDLINKNIMIDKKREEFENEVNVLKNKFELEQKELFDGLFIDDDSEDTSEENIL